METHIFVVGINSDGPKSTKFNCFDTQEMYDKRTIKWSSKKKKKVEKQIRKLYLVVTESFTPATIKI